MQELQLYIEGQRVELFKDETVSLTQTIQNVKDVSKIFTSFSKTFSLPASKTNNKIFKHYYNFDIVNGFDARIKKAGNIELNNIPFKTGRIKLEGVDLKNNLAHTYRITFFGNTVELPDILGDDSLGSLPFSSSDYTLTYSATQLRAFGVSQQGNGKIIVPLITHTQRLFYNSSSSFQGQDNVYYNTSAQQGVIFDQLKYAIRLYEIILEIEAKYTIANGYAANIVFSRDFFSTSNPVFYKLYMWLHRKSGPVQPAQQVTSYTTITPSWTGTLNKIIRSGNTIIITADLLQPPNQMFTYNIIVTPITGNSVPYQVGVNVNGVRILTTAAITGTTGITNLNGIPLVGNGVYTIQIIHGAAITIQSINWVFEGYTRQGTQAPVGYNETATISQFNAAAVFEFVVAQQIPEVKIMTFLSGLFKMFNLVAYVDDSKTIVVRPLNGSQGVNNSYYTSADINGNDAPVNYDISKYVDVTKSTVNVALPYKEIKYEFEGTGTFFAKQHAQLFGSAWGSLKYIGGQNSEGTGGINYNASTEIYSVKLPFEHMQYERLINQNGGAEIDVQWGWSVNENQQAYIGKPLIFYANLVNYSNPSSIQMQSSANTTLQLGAFWTPSNSLHLDATLGQENINFGEEQNEYSQSQVFGDTLFAGYHSQYIVDVFNTSRRITKLTAFLPLKILFNFKLNDTFTINSQGYIINSVTTNLQNGKSQMELLNNVSLYYGTINNVSFQGSLGVLYYRSSIGPVGNLSIGDIMFTNKALTAYPTAGTYFQNGTNNDETTFCDGTGFVMAMVIGTNGVITSIACGQP